MLFYGENSPFGLFPGTRDNSKLILETGMVPYLQGVYNRVWMATDLNHKGHSIQWHVTWCMCHVFYTSQNALKYHVAFEGSQQRSGSTDLQAMKYLLLTAKDFVGHDLTGAWSDWVGWSWRWLDSKRLFGEMWRLYTSLIWLVYTHITYMSPRLLMSLRLRKPHEATFTFNIKN